MKTESKLKVRTVIPSNRAKSLGEFIDNIVDGLGYNNFTPNPYAKYKSRFRDEPEVKLD